MDLGEPLTRWTVRAALVFYLLALTLRLTASAGGPRLAWARLAWTAGFLAFLIHVACAFHFFHHWSHRAAYDDTARQIAVVTGLAWGGGVYANYVFALVWGTDVGWWWRRPAGYLKRSRGVEWAVQGFLAFIAFNATVVFGAGPIRWAGLGASLLLMALLVAAARRQAVAG